MKRSVGLSFLFSALVLLAFARPALADTKTVTVPVGTTIEQTGTGQYRLNGPEGCVFEIKGFQRTSRGTATFSEVGFVGDCGIVDKNGKLIATATKGVLKSGPKPSVPTPDASLKIGDYTIWLPATIEFTPVRVFNRPALLQLCSGTEQPGKG
ncbi:MAG TPA: hypothetical protein VEG35_01110 [Burkholderiales bacterium]|nr:hypothetical protein [Burkholderiales bacterium]